MSGAGEGAKGKASLSGPQFLGKNSVLFLMVSFRPRPNHGTIVRTCALASKVKAVSWMLLTPQATNRTENVITNTLDARNVHRTLVGRLNLLQLLSPGGGRGSLNCRPDRKPAFSPPRHDRANMVAVQLKKTVNRNRVIKTRPIT